mmetsp:Transcript_29961/g.49454  ORF Transcript_29961/g.49454 Transcript_29961/m.49454 type:complete len:196 (-) Transcript_29961:301-888(-)|eukprot:CAMPEP_0119014952 /NCGR_PEP_ID=MMETSP1176-20130426/10477_1 /TAXON_ID=265551 /ORGANISM="Synedropsis recta cf, Strain CCMP1620" /LENGTH=195 /DNA_ID=CAMNT_0006968203 /DNA_START=135 /DNA_END=722 /DNA_ORIENTATION=-
MPIYRIKEKFWFWDSDFFVQDEKGHNLYKLNRVWFSPNQSIVLKEENDELLVIRKRIFSFKPCYQIVRNDKVLAEIKEKTIWFQQKHVLELADVEYVVDESKWKKKMFSIKHQGVEVAHVNKKMLDMSGSFWVDVKVDPTYYEGEAMKEMCLTVLAACIIMIQVLHAHDRQVLKKEQKDAVSKMPLQVMKDEAPK